MKAISSLTISRNQGSKAWERTNHGEAIFLAKKHRNVVLNEQGSNKDGKKTEEADNGCIGGKS